MPHIPRGAAERWGRWDFRGGQCPGGHILPQSSGMEVSMETYLPLQTTFTHPHDVKPPSEHSYSNSHMLIPCFQTSFTLEMHTVGMKMVTL